MGDEVDFSQYAFVYIGSGTERNQKVALLDLHRHREQLAEQINGDAVFLLTGNAFEMLGEKILGADNQLYDGLGLASFTVTEHPDRRYTGDAVCVSDWYAKPILGFVNKCSELEHVETPLFDIRMGEGNKRGDSKEGIRLHNLLGTHLTGPVLVKNPHFMSYLIKLIGGRVEGFAYQEIIYEHELRGYEVTLAELMQRMDNMKSGG